MRTQQETRWGSAETRITQRSEQWLLQRYRRTGDRHARERLMVSMRPLVCHVARHYRPGAQDDDLVQVAWIGLSKAVERYDPSYGVPLRGYAVPTMHGEVRRYLRDHAWSMHVPRPLKELVLATTNARQRLTDQRGRAPTTDEIAAEAGITVAQALAGMEAAFAYAVASLDAAAGDGDGQTVGTMGDDVGGADPRLERADEICSMRALRPLLDDRDRRILYLRFVEDLTQYEIAREVECSQMQVSRLLRRSLDRLHRGAHGEDEPEAESAPDAPVAV
jgi:RNA polymerase sigma-B factor